MDKNTYAKGESRSMARLAYKNKEQIQCDEYVSLRKAVGEVMLSPEARAIPNDENGGVELPALIH